MLWDRARNGFADTVVITKQGDTDFADTASRGTSPLERQEDRHWQSWMPVLFFHGFLTFTVRRVASHRDPLRPFFFERIIFEARVPSRPIPSS